MIHEEQKRQAEAEAHGAEEHGSNGSRVMGHMGHGSDGSWVREKPRPIAPRNMWVKGQTGHRSRVREKSRPIAPRSMGQTGQWSWVTWVTGQTAEAHGGDEHGSNGSRVTGHMAHGSRVRRL